MSIFELSSILTCVVTGVFAGSMLTEAGILVPYWRKMMPEEFLRLHHTMAPMLFRFFAPLTILGTLLPSVHVALGLLSGSALSDYSYLAAALSVAVLTLYFAFFKSANQSFADGTDPAQAAVTLKRWAFWHTIRTVGTITVFLFCTLALLL